MRMSSISGTARALAVGALLLAPGIVSAMCGEPFEANAFKRPIDYLDPADQEYVKVWVEPFHFTREVEALVRGKSTDIPGDLAYTLRQIPNHHRALNSMMRWQLAKGRPMDADERLIYTIQCYFERAIEFRPNDPVIYLLQGIYFHRAKKLDDAVASYRKAEQMAPENAEVLYNMGLVLVDKGDFALAKDYAERSYKLGYPMPGLRNRLKQLGKW